MVKPKNVVKHCFSCMKTIRGKPIEVFVLSGFCHSSYWENDKGHTYGRLNPDGEDGYLYLHNKPECASNSDTYRTYFGDDYEYCDSCGVTFNECDFNPKDYEETDSVNCSRCQDLKVSVLTPDAFPLSTTERITAHVFQDYDALDALAEKDGYLSDDNNSRCGWIPTMGDEYHSVEEAIRDLNDKVEAVKALGLDFVVGFCQTGNFSVGYSIYAKETKGEMLICS